MKPWVCIGKIISAHGIKGQVKIKAFTKNLDSFTKYGSLVNEKQEVVVLKKISIQHPSTITATIEDITTRNQAELLKGICLFIHEDNLPPLTEEEVYQDQLINFPLVTKDKILGIIIGVYNFGAGYFCEVRTENGKIGTIHLSSCIIHKDKLECQEDHFLI